MRVMQINAVSSVLSTGRSMKELTQELQKMGHETSVVYSEGTCDYSESYHMQNRVDKKIHALLSRISGLIGYFSWHETQKLFRYIDRWKPDVVRIANLHSNFINIPSLLRYLGKKNIPTVITLDDCFWFTGKCTHYTRIECYKWKKVCNHCPKWKADNKSWFFDRTERLQRDKKLFFDRIEHLAVVGVSKWVTNEAAKSNVLSNAREFTAIYNWIDMDIFQPLYSNPDIHLHGNRSVCILGVATFWSESKGLNDFIRIAIRHPEWSIILIGGYDNKINLPTNIRFIGRTDSTEELAKYYSNADVFVNPSQEETFGKVTAEALACGTPVVVYDTTASPELVGKGCGEIALHGDIDSLENAIVKVLAEKDEYTTIKCREYAKENFDLKTNTIKYCEVFRRIMVEKEG